MKRLLVLLFLSFFCYLCYPQNSGRVIYKSILLKNGYAPIIEELLFNGRLASYRMLEREKPDRVVEDAITGQVVLNPERPDSIHPLIYTDRQKGKVYSKNFLTFDDGETYESFYVEEDMGLHWEFSPEEIMIGDYLCKKATAFFRGRHYTAWYSEKIPLPIGPWKFHGLPGIILKVSDDNNEVQFILKNVEIPYEHNIAFPDVFALSLVTIQEYAEIREEASMRSSELFQQKLMSKLPRGATIEMTEDGTNEIEKNFK